MNIYQVDVIIEQSSVHDKYEVYAKSPVTAIARVLKENASKYNYSTSMKVEVFRLD